jgi:hypothetical protein
MLIRYIEAPGFRNALGFAVLAASTILTKYTGWFLFVLPLASVVCLRRFGLLRKRSFWVQPLIIGALVAPWTIWTSRYITNVPGKPIDVAGLFQRLWQFSVFVVQIMTPALAVAVGLGLVALALKPKSWRADTAVLAMLALGLISFLAIAPPAFVEHRYLLAAAAAVLVLAIGGWIELLRPRMRRGGAWTKAVPACALVFTVAIAAAYLGRFPRVRQIPVRPLVEAIVANPAWANQRILVAADAEGPMIAEFVRQDRRRPGHQLLRPIKAFATCNWYGEEYSSRFRTAMEMMDSLRKEPVALIVWHHRPGLRLRPHEALMDEMLRTYPLAWRSALRITASGPFPVWEVYQYTPPQ